MTGPVPSRREVLTGRVIEAGPLEAHVSSLVLHVRPKACPGSERRWPRCQGVDVPAGDGGKLVVTLETASEADIVARMNEMSLLPGVLSAALVFHHFETEPITEISQ